jgi:peptidylprolyl isomerase
MKYIIGIIVFIILIYGAFAILGKGGSDKDDKQTHNNASGQTAAALSANKNIRNNTMPTKPVLKNNIDTTIMENISKATFKTNQGDIVIELYKEDTPKTVANFVKLTKEGFYDDTKFHRVIKGFMIQGGDPLSKDDSKKSLWGTGGPGYAFADEIHQDNVNAKGTIAMANAGPNTNGSQFFINTVDNDFLNTKHTVFGKVVSGMEIVLAIEAAQTEPGDRPIEAMVIESIILQ